MAEPITNPILSRFEPWGNCLCWVVCNHMKQPCTIHDGAWIIPTEKNPVVPAPYEAGSLLRWKTEPQDHIVTMKRAYSVSEKDTGFGFGILLGHDNPIGCYDFDHVISPEGKVHPKIDQFLDWLGTFCEISSSGTGIHAFIGIDGKSEEYGFNKKVCDGKFYNNRFIKMTGRIYREFDLPVQFFDEKELRMIQEKIGAERPATTFTPSTYQGEYDCDWPKVLSDVGIPFVEAKEYIGKIKMRGDTMHRVEWSARIICPNYREHTGWQKRAMKIYNGGGDVAILTLWDDGLSSVVCNHNHCDGKTYKPNLLLKLWTEVKTRRADLGRQLLIKAGVRL